MKRVCVLGATGSIGSQTLAVISQLAQTHTDVFAIEAVVANESVDALVQGAKQVNARRAIVASPSAYQPLKNQAEAQGFLGACQAGEEAINAAIQGADVIVCGIAGSQGLSSVLMAVEHGKTVLLANKESLVMAGEYVSALATETGAQVIPVDSEHNALYQCFDGDYDCFQWPQSVSKLFLTASGGPFLGFSADKLATVTPSMAVKHPNWSMGAKISVDSATLMNKGLEVIEAAILFAGNGDNIKAVIHPQSMVHGLVQYCDGSIKAMLNAPDMRVPIAHSLGVSVGSRLPLPDLINDQWCDNPLNFSQISSGQFPCYDLAMAALASGPEARVVLNAANEVAVNAFLNGQCPFTKIPEIIENALTTMVKPFNDIHALLALDEEVRASIQL